MKTKRCKDCGQEAAISYLRLHSLAEMEAVP